MINKKILLAGIIASVATLSYGLGSDAYADDYCVNSGGLTGFYFGIQGGYGNTHWNSDTLGALGDSSTDTTGIAGRVFAGYQFTPFFATELGFLWPSNATNKFGAVGLKATAKEQIGDLDLKGTLPLANNFFAYAKVGAAYVHADVSGNATEILGLGVSRDIQNEVYPVFGAGFGYNVTPNIPIDISYMRVQSVAGSDNIPSIDFYAAGIAYNFG